jgi:hypothetical protein
VCRVRASLPPACAIYLTMANRSRVERATYRLAVYGRKTTTSLCDGECGQGSPRKRQGGFLAGRRGRKGGPSNRGRRLDGTILDFVALGNLSVPSRLSPRWQGWLNPKWVPIRPVVAAKSPSAAFSAVSGAEISCRAETP